MPKFVLYFLALSVLCAGGASGQSQGAFGQVAFGGSWRTTFTLLNLSSTDVAIVTLSFFGDNGSPLDVPVEGFGVTSVYALTLPAGGAQNVSLSNADSATTQGWASMSSTGRVRGQGAFAFLVPNKAGVISNAVVPLALAGLAGCVVPFPQIDPVILMPFDNTNGEFVTSVAFANMNAKIPAQSFVLEFNDQSNNQLATETLNMATMTHLAFVTPARYPALKGKKGIIRIHASASELAALGLLSNAAGVITTIFPVSE